MKKTILTAIVIASVFVISCNSNETTNDTTPNVDSITVTSPTVVDTTCTTHTVNSVDTKK